MSTDVRALLSYLPERLDNDADSRRIFHGRGQCFPGFESLCVDWYAPVLVVTLFSDMGRCWEDAVCALLRAHFSSDHSLYIQRRYLRSPSYEHVYGPKIENLVAKRSGLEFALQLQHQNIGFFLDIEPAREWLEQSCSGKRVLNLFSYTCSFSVLATHALAEQVVNMDLSSKSLNIGRQSYHLNSLSLDGVKFFANDILKSWSRLKRLGPYDVVIIDPPSFQKGSFVASKDYAKVLKRMSQLVGDRGMVLCCLNSPEERSSEFKSRLDLGLEGFMFHKQLQGSLDFPDKDPERALKMFVYRKQLNNELI